MTSNQRMPKMFDFWLSRADLRESDLVKSRDGFFLVDRSLAHILAEKGILDFVDSQGERLACHRFFDDWFLYAVPDGSDYAYGLLKLREQEYDAEEGSPADGDIPGVTVSFISLDCRILSDCLADPSDENRTKLNAEINRVVSYRGQCHHPAMKRYFRDPRSEGPYLVAAAYVRHIASFAENGSLPTPVLYREIVRQSRLCRHSKKTERLPSLIEALNQAAGYTVCDHERIYVKDRENPTGYEMQAILATHTGNPSAYSFAAEVEYHARFLTAWAKIRIPFLGRSLYASAVRADMTVGDTEFQGPAPFHREDSGIVRRQAELHRDSPYRPPVGEETVGACHTEAIGPENDNLGGSYDQKQNGTADL